MRRADRLFQIVQMLRRHELTTAAQLAVQLEVSERTIYRDVADLCRSGVPIQGEAGVGYQLSRGFELPPLMFNANEIQALVLGARMVESWGDQELRGAARSALDKVEAVLPTKHRDAVRGTALFAFNYRGSRPAGKFMPDLRRGIDDRRKVLLAYCDREGRATERLVRPLGLYFWGITWTLAAWCELRRDFRTFRLDRIESAAPADERFELEPPIDLDGYVRAMTGG